MLGDVFAADHDVKAMQQRFAFQDIVYAASVFGRNDAEL